MREKRNYGIDLLRIVSMIMIPVLHILGHGGVLWNVETLSVKYELVWLIEVAAYCAVDCYGLISGFVGYGSKYKYSNMLKLYFQVVFYTIIVTGISKIVAPEKVGIEEWIKAIFPFAYETYWYYTAYFYMAFFIPFLNLVLDACDEKKARKLILTIFILYMLVPLISQVDAGKTLNGYSSLWLGLLYLIGAYIKKYNPFNEMKNLTKIGGYCLCVTIVWGTKLVIELLSRQNREVVQNGNWLISFTSPLIVMSAVFLVLFFSNLEIGDKMKKWIAFFAPLSFGVYLIHEEPVVRNLLIKDKFIGYLSLSPIELVIAIIVTGIGIWFVCSLVDYVRIRIFSFLKIQQFSNWIVDKLLYHS